MSWLTVNDFIQDQMDLGVIPQGHKLMGYAVTNSDGHFALAIPQGVDSRPNWTADIQLAMLIHEYGHASAFAKNLRGNYRPAVIVGDSTESNRQCLYLPSDTDPKRIRPVAWRRLFQPELDRLITDEEMPAGSKMVGYVVRLVASDEFLVHYSNDATAQGWIWGLYPTQAKIFKDFTKASKIARRHKEADVFPLVDAGSHYFLFEQ